MTYTRPTHSDPAADGSATDLTVVLDALSDGLEAVEVRLQFNVDDYGAVGDGVTDDTDAIVAAVAAATAAIVTLGSINYAPFVFFTPGKLYGVTPGEIVLAGPGVRGTGAALVSTSTSAGAVVQIGSGSANTKYVEYRMPAIIYDGALVDSDWQAGTVGLKCIGMYDSQLFVDRIRGFEVGLWMTCATGAATAYNTIHIGDIRSNKINILIDGGDGANTGFCNENTYFGGHLTHAPGYGSNVTGCHQISILDSGTYTPDAHKFYAQSLESNVVQNYQHIYCEGGGNLFDWQRFESTYPGVVFSGEGSSYNALRTSYAITVDNSGASVGWTNRVELLAQGSSLTIRDTGVEFASRLTFSNGTANQKADIHFTPVASGGIWGAIEVELTSAYGSGNATGLLRKTYSLGGNSSGTIYTQVTRIADAQGLLPDGYALSDVTWDATNSRYRIQVVHRDSVGNTVGVRVRVLGASATGNVMSSWATVTLGSVYTTDATAFSRQVVTAVGSQVLAQAALSTSATDGFTYIPTCAGTPTGVPTTQSGTVPLVFDTTNHKLYFYSGGAWKGGTAPGTFS